MKRIICVIAVFCVSFIINSQDAQKKKIKLDEFLGIIEKKLPELKQNENDLLKAKNLLLSASALYDPALSANLSGNGKKIYQDGSITDIERFYGFSGEGGINGILPSGTMLSVKGGYAQVYTKGVTEYDYSKFGFPVTEDEFLSVTYDPVIKISITQPLLYNWFGFLDRYALRDGKLKLQIEKLKKIENDNEIKKYYKKLYFLWFQWEKILSYMEKVIENAKKFEQQTLDKYNNQISENDEYQRAKYSVYKYEEQYKLLIIEYKNILNELANFIDYKEYSPDESEFNAFYNNTISSNFDIKEFEGTRNSKILNLNKKSLENLKNARINQLFPQLNLFGNIDIKFHQYRNDHDDGTDKSTDYSISGGDIDFTAGIEFSYSLGNLKARADKKEAELLIEDIINQYDLTKNHYDKNMKNLVDALNIYKDVIKNKFLIKESLESRYRTEKIKYSQARLELYTLLESENLMTTEAIELMKSQVFLILLYFDYLNLTDSI